MASAEAGRLKKFKCAAGGRYQLPAKWYYVGDYGVEYLNARGALTDLEDFIADVCSSDPIKYASNPVVNVSDLQRSPGPASDEERTFTLKHGENKHCYKYVGPRVLNDEGKLNEEARKRYKRVIFTPSKGRCDIGLLRWSTELHNTLGVVVVPRNELVEYSQKWGAKRLIIGADQDCVGAARYHVIQLARYWGLKTFWMIDDSVPTSMLYQKTWNNPRGDPNMKFNDVLMTIESMTSQDRFSNAALIGLTSTFAVENLHKISARYVINERTPTSCVFVCLENVPDDLNYERRLPSKEDVIFAAQLIQAGKDVIIDRHIHFADYPFTEGGCTTRADDEEADSEETDSKETGSEETDSKETDSKETDSKETDSKETDSEETDNEGALSQAMRKIKVSGK